MYSFSKIKSTILVVLLLCCIFKMSSVAAQINMLNSLVKDSTDYNFNRPVIFRAGVHFPYGIQPFVSAEIKLYNRFTLNMQLGTSLNFEYNGRTATNPTELADSDKIGFSGFISPELRYYYFKPVGRMPKSDMPIKGFSGTYISIKYFASTPSNKINSFASYTYENVSALQLNTGMQFQIKDHWFFGLYAGAVLGKHPIQDGKASIIPLLQFGVTLGYVF